MMSNNLQAICLTPLTLPFGFTGSIIAWLLTPKNLLMESHPSFEVGIVGAARNRFLPIPLVFTNVQSKPWFP